MCTSVLLLTGTSVPFHTSSADCEPSPGSLSFDRFPKCLGVLTQQETENTFEHRSQPILSWHLVTSSGYLENLCSYLENVLEN